MWSSRSSGRLNSNIAFTTHPSKPNVLLSYCLRHGKRLKMLLNLIQIQKDHQAYWVHALGEKPVAFGQLIQATEYAQGKLKSFINKELLCQFWCQ
jgi:hypothetical protein